MLASYKFPPTDIKSVDVFHVIWSRNIRLLGDEG